MHTNIDRLLAEYKEYIGETRRISGGAKNKSNKKTKPKMKTMNLRAYHNDLEDNYRTDGEYADSYYTYQRKTTAKNASRVKSAIKKAMRVSSFRNVVVDHIRDNLFKLTYREVAWLNLNNLHQMGEFTPYVVRGYSKKKKSGKKKASKKKKSGKKKSGKKKSSNKKKASNKKKSGKKKKKSAKRKKDEFFPTMLRAKHNNKKSFKYLKKGDTKPTTYYRVEKEMKQFSGRNKKSNKTNLMVFYTSTRPR